MTTRRVPAALAAAVTLAVALSGCTKPAEDAGPTQRTDSTLPTSGFTNPVHDSNFPDPQIVKGESGWVAVATNGNGSNVQVLSSPDLVTWAPEPDALPHLPAWSSPGKVWAPEIVQLGGRWVMYYTTISPDPAIQCISVATATTAGGPYADTTTAPLVCEKDAGGSIDASPFVDVDGTAYLYWKNDGNAVGLDTWLSVQRLAPGGLALTGQPQRLLRQDLAWEGTLIEAPYVWLRAGRYHLFYSANNYASADYAVGHASSSSPTGPFIKDPEPVLASNAVAAGPGHCALFEKDGQVWMAYHAWPPDAVDSVIPGRLMWLSRVDFAADGRVTVQPPTRSQDRRP